MVLVDALLGAADEVAEEVWVGVGKLSSAHPVRARQVRRAMVARGCLNTVNHYRNCGCEILNPNLAARAKLGFTAAETAEVDPCRRILK